MESKAIELLHDVDEMLKRVRYFVGWGYRVTVVHSAKGYELTAELQTVSPQA